MAFADLGSLGAIGNTGNNQTLLNLNTIAAIAAGELVVVVVATDNIANGGDDNACTGVTLGVGGQALTKGRQVANAVAAQAGASCSVWYGVATSGLASGGIIQATYGSATLVDASAIVGRYFSKNSNASVVAEGTNVLLHNTAADPGSLDVVIAANIECLRIRGIAAQVGNNTDLTNSASWTAWANGNSATTGTTGEICARAEHRIVTGVNAASDPTYVSAINANVYVVLREEPDQPAGSLRATPTFITDTALTITLASLPSSSEMLDGSFSDFIDQRTEKYVDVLVGGKVTTGTTPIADRMIEVWCYASYDDEEYSGNAIPNTATFPSSKNLLRLITIIPTDATSNKAYHWGPVSVGNLYGGFVPVRWGIFVVHNTGVNLHATAGNHEIRRFPVNYAGT